MRINRTQDPVLKNRVIFTGELQPRRWLIITSVIVMTVSLASLAYFYLPFSSKPTTAIETSPINPLTSETSNPVVVHIPPVKIDSNNNQIKSELSESVVVPPVTPVEIQPSTTTEPLPAIPEQPATPPLGLNQTPSATLATPVDSSAELASLSPQEDAILPSPPIESAENTVDEAAVSVSVETKVDEAIVTDSATVPTSEPSTPTVESPVISAPPVAQSTQIASLLAKAKSQIKRTRLTSPQGDNAYETYQSLHQISPPEADSILDNIIAWYYEQGQKYLQRGRLTRSKNNAYQMYQKIKTIAPQHPSTTLLLQGIIDQLQQQFAKQFQRQQFLTPIGNNAYTTYQDLMTVATKHQDIQPLQDKMVKQLLREAQRQLTEEKYTTPKNDNAVDTYQKILAIAPQHVAAQQGIQKVVQEYYQRALRQQREQSYRSSLLWIKRGLKIAPDDPQLQQLKQEIEDNLSP